MWASLKKSEEQFEAIRTCLKHGLPVAIKAAYGHGTGTTSALSRPQEERRQVPAECALYTEAREVGEEDTAQSGRDGDGVGNKVAAR
ncbi:hypothetical protein IAQ61_011660 [Plenodomus lingam]|uniref:uncharacterized protein n=1 Tax=Leptosphaeria maculans TaxID=5022 RepID=UPI0033294F08|nr:hypothetical protein IAQ61_011660 [Plenodomus lingam]